MLATTRKGKGATTTYSGNVELYDATVPDGDYVTTVPFSITFTPTGGSPMPETDTSSKAATIASTTTCTIPLQTLFSGPEGALTIQGTVTGFFTPR